MAVERQFIVSNLKKIKVKEYLEGRFKSVGIGKIDIQKTPFGTNVVLYSRRPGLIIGKRGDTIRDLTDKLKDEMGLDNPQVEVMEVENPNLNAQIVANSVAAALERGLHFRRAAYSALRNVMQAGALGVQILISGKLSGERSRSERFYSGYIKHCGEPAERFVLKGFAEALPKLGKIGVQVKILPPGIQLTDDVVIREKPLAEAIVAAEEKTGAAKEEAEVEGKTDRLNRILAKNAKDAAKSVYSTDLTADEIKILLEKEEKSKNRKTVVDALKKKVPTPAVAAKPSEK